MAKINAKSLVSVEEIKAEKPVRLARINEHKHKSGVKWIDGLNALVLPLTTFFWIIAYPLLLIYLVRDGFLFTDPLALIDPFTKEIIACILGFWYTDIKSCKRNDYRISSLRCD
ncbi:hypothetical protein G293_03880 [Candidatus Liberibacter africanus PTSAPSY]|uniref:Uncharacterized protein n=1 Tax=Candidatus Liberibacter africanus PTSAPSY TaxID=1277257 RepID=A0A0G3I9G6_LIBAF|nr:hypothetical protein [Candidatus Liberibacter africanus]AKK20402.1 hypothetical protein G293_03880 [Candidatus Liberibacter africanus PTSAPSY]